MDFEDIVRIGFILLIASGFLFRGGGGKKEADPDAKAPGKTRIGPRSLSESGGQVRPAPRRDLTPAPVNTTMVSPGGSRTEARREELLERYGDGIDTSAVREDVTERGPSAASMPTAEERPRPRRPRQAEVAPTVASAVGSASIRQLLGNRESVRTAFVLQEVLGTPVGMRERDDR